MAISQLFSGSATIGTTEYDLPTSSTTVTSQTADGVYQLFVDFANLTSTEEYILRIYETARAGDARRLVEDIVISGVQSAPLFASASLLFLHGWTFTLQKTQGTDRVIAWSIRAIT